MKAGLKTQDGEFLDPHEGLKRRLLDAKKALDQTESQENENSAIVTLDQQSVGRLSRIDALQRQAMAQSSLRRIVGERRRIEAALERLEEDEYGYCVACGEEIAPERLDADPAVPTCLTCARG